MKVILSCLFIALATFSESVGILIFIPLFESLMSEDTSRASSGVFLLNEIQHFFGAELNALVLIIAIAVLFIIKGIFLFASKYWLALLRADLLVMLKRSLLHGLANENQSRDLSPGYMSSVINEQVSRTLTCFLGIMNCVSQTFVVIVLLTVGASVSWEFACFGIFFGFIFLAIFKTIVRRVKSISDVAAKLIGTVGKSITQFVRHQEYTRITGRSEYLLTSLDRQTTQAAQLEKKRGLYDSFSTAVREPLAVVSLLALTAGSYSLLDVTFERLVVCLVIFYRALTAILSLIAQFQAALNNMGSAEIVRFELGYVKAEPITTRTHGKDRVLLTSLGPPDESIQIELRDLTFYYETVADPVIDRLSVTIKPRSVCGIIGPSGTGKTTLLKLMTGLLTPSSGHIYVNDVSINDLNLPDYRSRLGYVPQSFPLYPCSLRENLLLGNRSPEVVDDDAIFSVLKELGLDDAIIALPEGLDTYISEAGQPFSQGQQQRLVLAREILDNPTIIFLDEPSSSLDYTSAKQLAEVLDRLKKRATLVVISHDEEFLSFADAIISLKKSEAPEK